MLKRLALLVAAGDELAEPDVLLLYLHVHPRCVAAHISVFRMISVRSLSAHCDHVQSRREQCSSPREDALYSPKRAISVLRNMERAIDTTFFNPA